MGAGDVELTGVEPFPEYPERRIHGLIRDFARDNDARFASCLDVGCGRSRYDRWFREKFQYAVEPRRYIGLDDDEDIVADLRAEGVDAHPSADGLDVASDLTLCLEVIEHVPPADSDDFLRFVEANTRQLVALTTPNFEYWRGDNFKIQPDYRELRWIPDHAPTWKPRNGGPHAHKQWMTPQVLDDYFTRLFPRDRWRHAVYRAWPWDLHDRTTDATFRVHFKLFALAWRVDAGGAEPSAG